MSTTLKDKCKDFFLSLKSKISSLLKDKTVRVCLGLLLLYLISGYCKWIEIGVSVGALVSMLILPLQSALCIFMFLHSFTLSNIGYNSCFVITFVGFCLILAGKYIWGLKNKKYVFHKKIAILIGVFYLVAALMGVGKPVYYSAFMYLTYLPLIYCILAMRKEFNICEGMNYMFAGLLMSCGVSVVTLILPGFQYYPITQGRFHGFINNTNYVYMRAIFILTYYMYRNLNKKLSNTNFLVILLLCSLIIFATMSKTGILMLGLFIFIYLILCLKSNFKKNIKFVGIFVGCMAIVALISLGYILNTLSRFLEAFNSSNFLNSLLTQRDEIWILYLKAIFSSPFKVLFGHGLLTKQVVVENVFGLTETHNFYIWLLYRFGLAGTIFVGYIIYLIVKEFNPGKPKFIAYLPLIFILLESLCDNTMKYYNIAYFIFAMMILFIDCEKPSNTEIEETTQQDEATTNNDTVKEE